MQKELLKKAKFEKDAEQSDIYVNNLSNSLRKRREKSRNKQNKAVDKIADLDVALIPIVDPGNKSTSSLDSNQTKNNINKSGYVSDTD